MNMATAPRAARLSGVDSRRLLLLGGWTLVLLVGAALRLWHFPDRILGDDEWHALHKALDSGFRGILTSFGQQDYSIPLTALYHAILRAGGDLTEWTMRGPLLAAGIAMLLVIPWLLRPLMQPGERLLLGGLLAISPLLIHFSRQARPYTLAVLLTWVALLAFWHWWHGGRRRWAAAYVIATALAGWLLPVTLAFTLAPFLFFGALGAWTLYREGSPAPLFRLIGLGLITLVPLIVLIGPPLYFDLNALTGKAGVHSVTPLTGWIALELFVGASHTPLTLAALVLAGLGASVVLRRAPKLTGYLGFVALIASIAILSTNAAWIHHGLVVARYLLPALPLLLLLVAAGVWVLLKPLPWTARPAVGAGLLAALYAIGPLPAQYHQPVNQFTGHLAYQFDYNFSRNTIRNQMPRGPTPAFYEFLAEQPPRSQTLVFVPWYVESFWNRLHYHQQAHRQQILVGLRPGYCIPRPVFGEYLPNAGVALRNMVHLSDLREMRDTPPADYLVFHRDMPRENAERLNEWLEIRTRKRPLGRLDQCLEQLRADFGPAAFEDEATVVFRLNPAAPLP